MAIPTKEKLAQVLHAAGLIDLERQARAGVFDDYASESPTPISDLVHALLDVGRQDLAERAIAGEWDGTPEESAAWEASPEGREAIASLRDSFRRKP